MSALPQFPVSSFEAHREPSIEEFSSDLARANQFKPSDIQANRNGFVSTGQFFRLLWQATKPLRQATWSVLVWIALLGLVASIFKSRFMRMAIFHNYAFEVLGVSISLAVAFVVGFLNTTSKSWLLLKDLLAGEVTSVEGRLDASWQEEVGEGFKRIRREMVPSYQYLIRQKSFEVQPNGY